MKKRLKIDYKLLAILNKQKSEFVDYIKNSKSIAVNYLESAIKNKDLIRRVHYEGQIEAYEDLLDYLIGE